MTQEKCWRTGTKRVELCDFIDRNNYEIHLPSDIHQEIVAISAKMDNFEWLGYLFGSKVEHIYYITSMQVPEQEVFGSSVEKVKPIKHPDVIGTVHLHPFSGAGFLSPTDETYIGGNHLVTISYNSDGVYEALVKCSLPCEASILIKATLIIDMPIPRNLDHFVAVALKKITKGVYPTVVAGANNRFFEEGENYYTSGMMTCSVCHNKFYYSQLTWSQGVSRCPECQKKWEAILAKSGVGWRD